MPDEDKPSAERTLATYRSHLLLTSVTITAAFAFVIAVSIFVPLSAHLGREPVDFAIAPGLAEHFLFLHSALWPIVVLSLISCIVSSTILFQRMRSPLVRFTQCFEKIEQGKPPSPIVIRKADYLREEAAILNRMLRALVSRADARRRASDRFDEIVDELSSREIDPILLDELISVVKTGVLSPALSVSEGDAEK